MRFTAAKPIGQAPEEDRIGDLTRYIGRLLRHPAFRREQVVSPMLQRHLPPDAGYAWRGEAGLREQLTLARLDAVSLDHLIGNARSEFARLRGPVDA